MNARSIVAIVILGVIATGLARSLAALLTGRVGAVRGAVHAYFIPVLAVVFGVVLLGEKLTPLELIGLPITLAGGYLVTLRDSPTMMRMHRLNRPPASRNIWSSDIKSRRPMSWL
jgi:drug/metabolite transporter (DMT)-like permease